MNCSQGDSLCLRVPTYAHVVLPQCVKAKGMPVVVHDPTLSPNPPFTDWQNDLHLILGFDRWFLLRPLLDLATLITAATRYFSGTVPIGSCEDRSGYACCRVPH